MQLAETGDSKDLERELKDDVCKSLDISLLAQWENKLRLIHFQSANIRTIIKARGLRHPNFYGHKTFAVFRADKDHNLISLVSKIGSTHNKFLHLLQFETLIIVF